jgi:hypothetical protein
MTGTKASLVDCFDSIKHLIDVLFIEVVQLDIFIQSAACGQKAEVSLQKRRAGKNFGSEKLETCRLLPAE